MEPLLKVEHVTKTYANHTALDDVSINVPAGKIYGLLGPNGAGKTTLIRIINHITAPDSGIVTFDGHRLCDKDLNSIGYLPEERGLYKKMKVGEQAIFFARLKGLSRNEATRELKAWFERFEISSWWDRKVEELSKGMAQKVQFIVTVLHRPRLLIFDEPFSGFDPVNANLLKNEILNLRDNGATVIFSTHNMASVEELCDEITLINKSRNVLTGKVDDLRREFAAGRYNLRFKGETIPLLGVIEPLVQELEMTEEKGINNAALKLNPDTTLRDLIGAANPLVEIVSLTEAVTSMNDIFIRTVGDNPAADQL